MRSLATLLGCSFALLLLAEPTRAEVVARLPNESAISAYGGVAVVSVQNPERTHYALTRIHEDGRLERLPGVPPRDEPFDADVGPDTRGRPVVAYSRCRTPESRTTLATGCDLVLHRIGRTGEEPVRTASTRTWDESEPTVWRGRIAWAVARGERTAILARDRLASRAQPPRRVQRGAGYGVSALELHGRRLAAMTARLEQEEFRVETLRLHDLGRGGRTRTLDEVSSGIGGQRFVGPAFGDGRLGWLMACFGDPGGCRKGPSTHDLRTGRTTVERRYRPRVGYALVPGGTLEVGGGGRELGDASSGDPDFANTCAQRPRDEAATCPVIFRPRR